MGYTMNSSYSGKGSSSSSSQSTSATRSGFDKVVTLLLKVEEAEKAVEKAQTELNNAKANLQVAKEKAAREMASLDPKVKESLKALLNGNTDIEQERY